MDISYIGHSCFRLRGKTGTVIMDPFVNSGKMVLPKLSADLVTASHQHEDHNAVDKVGATSKRDKPFIIDAPGEYEVGEISVFGIPSYHDSEKGAERGRNIMFVVRLDNITVGHLGDLGHLLTASQVDALGKLDVLCIPVGGVYTIDAKQAIETIKMIEPSYVIPMHYKTPDHDELIYGGMASIEDFMSLYGVTKQPQDSLNLSMASSTEETELVWLHSLA